MSTWLINGDSPENLGLRLVGGEFRTGGASTVTLERVCDFDASESLNYGDAVTITRDSVTFFQGKCRQIPKSATSESEGHGYLIEDAWADLERTVYQEYWGCHGGTFLSPTVVLGMNSSGTRIGVGTQIIEAINFAASAGVDIVAGTIPAGMMLWPSEVSGMSCAEVIRTTLRYYPDWVAWIDHSTSPPTFNVTPRATATARTLAVTSCTAFDVTKTSDRVPDCVRIVFLTANMVDDEVYRDGTVQKYPLDGADSGPGVLTTVIELAGMRMQREKQQIQVRPIPDAVEEDKADAKAYLKLKFPAIADIANTKFRISEWVKTIIPDDEVLPDPIDTKLERKKGETLTHLPNELVRGSIPEWLQKRVGKVLIDFAVVPNPATATEADRKLLSKLPADFTVVATNAETKIYKGVSSYTAGDQAPAGIAQAYYETLANGCYYEGKASLVEQDVGATRWHGSVLNISGGVADWATMKAPIHAVSWDIQSQKVDIHFGPNPDYAVQDFLEFLRLLNKRPNTEYTLAERTSDKLGSEAGISASGDSIGPFDTPETTTTTEADALGQFEVHDLWLDGSDWKCRVKAGYVVAIDPEPGTVMAPIAVTPADTTEHTVSASTKLWCKVTTAKDDLPTAGEIIVSAAPTDAHAQPEPGGQVGSYHYLIAEFETVDDVLVVKNQFHKGGPIIHRPGRNNRNLDLIIHAMEQDSNTGLLSASDYFTSPKVLSWRQGVFVGLNAGAASNLIQVNCMAMESHRAADLP